MFEASFKDDSTVVFTGRLDAAQTDTARSILDRLEASAIVDCQGLSYISSAGLGVLFAAQKRLKGVGHGLKLRNLNSHLRDVFRYAQFDKIFEIE
jgi:anti-anti-sigma factor